MKRVMLSSLSILFLSAVVSPVVRAEANSSSDKENQDDVRQVLIAQERMTSQEFSAIADNGTPGELARDEWLAANAEVSVIIKP